MLPIGTRIRFTKTLECGPTSDCPAFLFALKGELGEIIGHGTKEGYWAKTDSFPHSFGLDPLEFEVVPSNANVTGGEKPGI